MSYEFAGRWGPAVQVDSNGPRVSTAFTVRLRGTGTTATLYTDRTKASAAGNPMATDTAGLLVFFAEPGEYDLFDGLTTVPVTVGVDPVEAQAGALLALAEITTAITTTNASYGNNGLTTANGGRIPAASLALLGTGRRVWVEAYFPQARHSVANASVASYLLLDGAVPGGQLGVRTVDVAAVGQTLLVRRPIFIADGVTRTFEVGVYGSTAGTVSLDHAGDPTPVVGYLAATQA